MVANVRSTYENTDSIAEITYTEDGFSPIGGGLQNVYVSKYDTIGAYDCCRSTRSCRISRSYNDFSW